MHLPLARKMKLFVQRYYIRVYKRLTYSAGAHFIFVFKLKPDNKCVPTNLQHHQVQVFVSRCTTLVWEYTFNCFPPQIDLLFSSFTRKGWMHCEISTFKQTTNRTHCPGFSHTTAKITTIMYNQPSVIETFQKNCFFNCYSNSNKLYV